MCVDSFSIITLVTEPILLFLLFCLWRFRTGQAFVLGFGQLGITLADAGTFSTGQGQGTENPFGPGRSSFGQGSMGNAANAYPSAYAPPMGPEGGLGYQQPLGSGAPVIMDGTYSSHT